MDNSKKPRINRKSPCVRAKEHMKETYGETSRRKMNAGSADPLARPFLQTASMNLKSAKALYEIENYPDAVFMLQQSIEKITKSYALFFGFLDEKAAKIIAHDILCIYEIIHLHLLEEQKEKEGRFKENPMLYSFFFNYRNNLENRMLELESFRKELYRQKGVIVLKKLSSSEINLYLHSLDKVNIDCTEIFKKINPFSEILSNLMNQLVECFFNEEKMSIILDNVSEKELKQNFPEIWSNFAQMSSINLCENIDESQRAKISGELKNQHASPVISEDISIKDLIKAGHSEMIKSIGENDKKHFEEMSEKLPQLFIGGIDTVILSVVVFSQLINLAIPVSRHVTLSRYPEPAKNFNPLEFYTPELPLVASFPRLADHTDKCIQNLNYLYHQLEAVETKGKIIVESDN